MTFMIHNIIDFGQIKSNKFAKNISCFNVRDTVENVMEIQRKKAEEQNLDFISVFENIDTQEQPVDQNLFSPLIWTDEQRLKQVILCLQANALKFTQEGSVRIVTKITKDQDENTYLKISV